MQVAATQIGDKSIAPGLRTHMSCCRNHNVSSQEQQCASSHLPQRHLCTCAPCHSKVPFPHTHTCRKRASSSLMDSRRLSSSSFFSLSSYVEGSMLGKMRSRNGSRNSRNGMTCNRSHGGRVEVLQVAAYLCNKECKVARLLTATLTTRDAAGLPVLVLPWQGTSTAYHAGSVPG